MKWYIPREHGAWSMWLTPLLLGIILSPWSIYNIPLFFAVFFFYMSSAPLLTMIRTKSQKENPLPCFLIYVSIALFFLVLPVVHQPNILLYGFLIAPLFFINLYFAKIRKERILWNDIIAIMALSSTFLVAYHIGTGVFLWEAVFLWAITIIFFIGSVFHVKAFIREKRNFKYKIYSNLFHILITLLPIMLGHWWISIIFLPSLVKVLIFNLYKDVKPMFIGIIEIVGSVLFFVIFIFIYFG